MSAIKVELNFKQGLTSTKMIFWIWMRFLLLQSYAMDSKAVLAVPDFPEPTEFPQHHQWRKLNNFQLEMKNVFREES